MRVRAAVTIIAASAVLSAGCASAGHRAAPASASGAVGASSPIPTVTSVPTVTTAPALTACQREFQGWSASPGNRAIGRTISAMSTLAADANAGNLAATGSDLTRFGSLALTLARHPFPRCADPHRYYSRMIVAMLLASAQSPGVMLGVTSSVSKATAEMKKISAAAVKLTAAVRAQAP